MFKSIWFQWETRSFCDTALPHTVDEQIYLPANDLLMFLNKCTIFRFMRSVTKFSFYLKIIFLRFQTRLFLTSMKNHWMMIQRFVKHCVTLFFVCKKAVMMRWINDSNTSCSQESSVSPRACWLKQSKCDWHLMWLKHLIQMLIY